ncbi:MAG: hypothetical protein J6J17_04545 [Bacilli bacterium]|nr:hypothetical protein [Bacilli bacterium]
MFKDLFNVDDIFDENTDDVIDADYKVLEEVTQGENAKNKKHFFKRSKKKQFNSLLHDLQQSNPNIKIEKLDNNKIVFDDKDYEKNGKKFDLPIEYDYDKESDQVFKDGRLIATIVYKDLENKREDNIDLSDINIEEVTQRQNKNKRKLFKKKNKSKEDVDLSNIDIDEVTKRKKGKKISMFISKIFKNIKNKFKKEEVDSKDNNIINQENENNYDPEDISLKDKILKYLDGVTYTIKDLIHIMKKADIISEKEEKLKLINEFLDNNKNLENDKKLVSLVLELDKLANNFEMEKAIKKTEKIKEFLEEKGFDLNSELIDLYNEIINSEENYIENVNSLYSYIINNKEEITLENIINEMNKILGKTSVNEQVKDEDKIRKLEEKKKQLEKEIEKRAKEEAERKAREEAKESSYKHISKLINLSILYKSQEELDKAKLLFSQYHNCYTIRQNEDIKLNIENAQKNINTYLNSNENSLHPFIEDQISKVEKDERLKRVGDITLSRDIYKDFCERMKNALTYNSITILNIEEELFNRLDRYLTLSQKEDIKQKFKEIKWNISKDVELSKTMTLK